MYGRLASPELGRSKPGYRTLASRMHAGAFNPGEVPSAHRVRVVYVPAQPLRPGLPIRAAWGGTMRVLVTWGSKRGGTEGIARIIGERLIEAGHEVVFL